MLQIKIGLDSKLLDQFKTLHAASVNEIDKAVKLIAEEIRNVAVKNISQGSRKGRLYKRRSIQHRASAPGEFPKTDTGRLVNSIRINFSYLTAEIGSDVKYSKYLETGTINMKPRPWLSKSVDIATDKSKKIIDSTLKRVFKT